MHAIPQRQIDQPHADGYHLRTELVLQPGEQGRLGKRQPLAQGRRAFDFYAQALNTHQG